MQGGEEERERVGGYLLPRRSLIRYEQPRRSHSLVDGSSHLLHRAP